MTHPSPSNTVAELAVRFPTAGAIFLRHDIDFCCGGGRPLGVVCEEKGLDAASVLAEITAAPVPSSAVRWDEAPVEALVDHILIQYHRPLDHQLPGLQTMAEKVARVHGDKDPRLAQLRGVVTDLVSELQLHMHKEEQILFPWIVTGDGSPLGPIRVMQMEHEDAGRSLAAIRELTDEFTIPEGACNTWTALWMGLKNFDRELREHIHLENNVLFPRALAG